jgi:pSer/pThr/pTyr-binding forkhead associated (FHA) protein
VWQRPPTINQRAPKAVLAAVASGKIFELQPDREMIIGRGDTAKGIEPDVALTDEAALTDGVSRLHAKVFCQDNTYYLSDLNSTNSTYLNGQKLVPQQPSRLKDGDEIHLGRYLLRLRFI